MGISHSGNLNRLHVVVACLVLWIVPDLRASVIALNSPAGFAGMTGIAGFDNAGDQTVANNYYAAQGVVFTRDDGQAIPVLNLTALGLLTASPNNGIATISGNFTGGAASVPVNHLNAVFTAPVFEIGAWFGNDQLGLFGYTRTTLEIFGSNNNLLGSVFVDTNDNFDVDQFIGVRSTDAFVRARFTNNGNLSVVLDDVQFTQVPEPASMWLLAAGCASLALIRKGQPRT